MKQKQAENMQKKLKIKNINIYLNYKHLTKKYEGKVFKDIP